MKGGDILIECLKAQGVRCIFGMPGTQNLHIYDALKRRGDGAIGHYLVRHEYAATKMADGFARSTGDVGVALTVPGPGASNASTGILEAFTDCVPVLLITGQSESKFYQKPPSKLFHGLDQMRFFDPITKYCAIAESVEDIPTVVEDAFRAMRSGRPGPAVLEFPMDVIEATSDAPIPERIERPSATPPEPADLAAAAKLLMRSEKPILFVGSAVIEADAREALRHVAEKLDAPVIVTRRAKGVLAEDHPLALCHVRSYPAYQALHLADCTLAVGTRFTSLDTNGWSLRIPCPMIQIDEDPEEVGREYSCDIGIVGDLKVTLESLSKEIGQRKRAWPPILADLRDKVAAQPPLPLLPEMRTTLPADGILVSDVHALGYTTFAEFPVAHPRCFLYPCIGVSLGYALPAALGAKIAHPEKPVVCFSGDGGFLMGASELATAARYDIRVVMIVVNDNALSSIKGSQQQACEGRLIDSDLRNPDFVALARSFGIRAERVQDLADFGSTFEEAVNGDRPVLIEVPMEERQAELIASIEWLQPEPTLRKG
jgi:acetolactate synthase-1/2/3 large subunit